jgi:hypothetical protein
VLSEGADRDDSFVMSSEGAQFGAGSGVPDPGGAAATQESACGYTGCDDTGTDPFSCAAKMPSG